MGVVYDSDFKGTCNGCGEEVELSIQFNSDDSISSISVMPHRCPKKVRIEMTEREQEAVRLLLETILNDTNVRIASPKGDELLRKAMDKIENAEEVDDE